MTPPLDTPRLLLAPLALEDAPQIQRIFPRWEIVRYLGARVPWPYPPDGALTFIRNLALPAMVRGTEFHWTLRLRSAPSEIIGVISLRTDTPKNRGFWLAPEHWGNGLMSEACERVTAFWFDTLGMLELRTGKAIENVASRRLSEKQGMRIVGTEDRDCVCGRVASEIWAITAEEWRASRPSRAQP